MSARTVRQGPQAGARRAIRPGLIGTASDLVLVAGHWLLRRPRADEAAQALVMLSDPGVAMWNPARRVVDLDTAREWCERAADWASGAHATFSVVDPVDDRLVGNVSLFAIDAEHLTASVGYRVAPAERGRGVATAALAAVAEWALGPRGLARVWLQHAVDNTASCTVATRAGFELEGTMRSASVYGDGRRHDDHLHARTRT
ncbi:MAG TPA: GNAT family protein [Mycobacteriales bacterium]|nr:GNAT family protein [Mycobacteriales bacterium]